MCKSYFGPLISRKLWEARSRMGVAKDVIDFAILRIWCVQDDFQKLRPSWRPRPVEPLHQLFDLMTMGFKYQMLACSYPQELL